MAGPIVGSVEHYFNGVGLGTASVQVLFVNTFNFLNNNTASLGIQRLAYNTGSKGAGMVQFRGMNYYDQPLPAGENAWAVFRFLSASIPFDVLIQWAGVSGLGTAPGAPALINNTAGTNAFAIAVAQRADMTSAWGGSTNNNGSDTKSTPVWISSSISSTIYYPRSNDAIRGGTHGASRQNMMGNTFLNNIQTRHHFMADYDNFAIFNDVGAANAYELYFFGMYTPMSGLNVNVPYFAFHDAVLPIAAATAYGPAGGGTPGGGIGYPQQHISGSVGVGFDRIGTTFFQSSAAQANLAFPTPRWDEFPLIVGVYETTPTIIEGMTGQHFDFLREAYNIATHDTNGDGSRAVFGSTTVASLKVTAPFHTGTSPGSGVTRAGVQFTA